MSATTDAPTARTALVTGCSSGFGLLTALDLAHAGFRVVATMRNLAKRGPLDEAARQEGVRLEVRELDVTREDTMRRCLEEIGRVDVLVNNAGYGLGGFAEDVTMDELRAQMETNFFGAVALTKACLPQMRERRAGRIIMVSSGNGRMAVPALSSYCASKFALEGWSEALRYEMRPFGVHVSIIEPGSFRTPIFDANARLAAGALSPDSPYRELSLHMLALTRKMLARNTQDPRQVARAIVAAATARRPRLRYLVGRDVTAQAWLQHLLPPRLFESVLMRFTLEAPRLVPDATELAGYTVAEPAPPSEAVRD